jgi:spore coat protein U-like protein
MRIGSLIAGTAMAAILPLAPALAATATTNMAVSINIVAACVVGVTPINFLNQTAPTVVAGITSTAAMGGLFSYTCPIGLTPALTAGQGSNFGAGSNRMKGATSGTFITYSLNVPSPLAASTGAAQTAQVTATITAQASPAIDSYTDTVVLTLTY